MKNLKQFLLLVILNRASIQSYPLPSTPTNSHPPPPPTPPPHPLPLICSSLPSVSTLFSHSHSFVAHSYPLSLMFIQLLLNLILLPPMYSHFQSTTKQFTSSIRNCIFPFWNYSNVSSTRLQC